MSKNTKKVFYRIFLLMICFGVNTASAQIAATQKVISVAATERPTAIIESGVGSTIIVVFIVLAALLWGFRLIGNLMVKKETEAETALQITQKDANQNTSDEEVSAAITMSLYLYTSQIHDQENPVITMIKVSRTYSPWSSKIYGLRKSPR